MKQAELWVTVKNNFLSERSQMQDTTYYVITFISEMSRKGQRMYRESRLVVAQEQNGVKDQLKGT